MSLGIVIEETHHPHEHHHHHHHKRRGFFGCLLSKLKGEGKIWIKMRFFFNTVEWL